MKTLIIVPAFNEAKTLPAVLRDLQSHQFRNILVVDDGSSDQTAKMSRGAVLLRHTINRGLGAALGTGFAYAQKNHYDAVVTFDADGQHQAADLPKLLEPIKSNRADVVIGCRQFNLANTPFDRLVYNLVSNLVTFVLYGTWSNDTLSGLRAFNKKALESIKIKTQRMEVSNEFFKEIKRNKLRLAEIPIDAVYSSANLKRSHQGGLAVVRIGLSMVLRLFR